MLVPLAFLVGIIRSRNVARKVGAMGAHLRLTLAMFFYIINLTVTAIYLACIPSGLVVIEKAMESHL